MRKTLFWKEALQVLIWPFSAHSIPFLKAIEGVLITSCYCLVPISESLSKVWVVFVHLRQALCLFFFLSKADWWTDCNNNGIVFNLHQLKYLHVVHYIHVLISCSWRDNYWFGSLQCSCNLSVHVYIFVLCHHLGFGKCGGLGRGKIYQGSRCEAEKVGKRRRGRKNSCNIPPPPPLHHPSKRQIQSKMAT